MIRRNIIIAIALIAVLVCAELLTVGHPSADDWSDTVAYRVDTVTVRLQLRSGTSGEKATLIYPDFVEMSQKCLHPVTDATGSWQVKIPAFRTLHIQIWDNNKIEGVVWGAIDLFCRPGSETTVEIDDIENRCRVTGDDALAVQEAMAHPLKLKNFHGMQFDIEMEEAAKRILAIHQENLRSIDTLQQAHPGLSQRYLQSLRTRERYSHAVEVSQNVMGHIHTEFFKNDGKIPDRCFSMIKEVAGEELLHPTGPLTIDAIQFFNDMACIKDMELHGLIREWDEEKEQWRQQLEWRYEAIDSLGIEVRDKPLLKAAYFLGTDLDLTPEREQFVSEEIGSPFVMALLKEKLAARDRQWSPDPQPQAEEEDDTPPDSLTDGRSLFQKLIAPYRGRVVYVDVWGTWCGPCKEEMGYAHALHDTLRGMEVVYMTLANNSPHDLWQKAIKKFKIDTPDCANFNLPKAQESAIEQFLGIGSYPTYLLVAPDGRIVTDDAPRPSNPARVKEAILKILSAER